MYFKLFAPIIATLFLLSGCEEDKPRLKLQTNAKNNVFKIGQSMEVSVENPSGITIDSVLFFLSGKPFKTGDTITETKLGKQELTARVFHESKTTEISATLTILNDKTPEVYSYELLNTYPHDIESYTQGLEFSDGWLLESTGQRGKSKLRKIEFSSGRIEKNVDLNRNCFGEGLTVLNDKVYQLTWQSKQGFVYELESFERIDTFKYGESKEGWGLCNDGEFIYKSDGTEKIWRLDPETLKEIDFIQAYTNKGKIVGLNELEWINGKIYANRYQKNGVAIINPENGAIDAVIDFSPLRKKVKRHPELDVLNGIAFNKQTNTIFVTGKNWNKLFEVKVIED